MTPLVGRERERKVLDIAMESPEAELVAVYGRRRVGKTFLVRRHLANAICFELTGIHAAPLAEQIGNFSRELAKVRRGGAPPAASRSWAEAFDQLVQHLGALPRRRQQKRVVFFDELPWLASAPTSTSERSSTSTSASTHSSPRSDRIDALLYLATSPSWRAIWPDIVSGCRDRGRRYPGSCASVEPLS